MGRINKTNKTTPVSDDEFIIYDSEDTSDDKNVTLGQIAEFTEAQDSTVAGDKTFSGGCAFAKGLITYGAYSPFPTGYGTYVASYVSSTYGARLLGYNGTTYQDLGIGSMPTAGTVSMKSLANGDCNFGYSVNIAEDLGVTGDVTGNSFSGDGSGLTDVGTKNITQLGTCSTASATAEKAVTLDGFTLSTGAVIQVTFNNANTATTPTLNVNSTGAKTIKKGGNSVGSTHPAYFPAGSIVEFIYDGTNWCFNRTLLDDYYNGTSWYEIYSDGMIRQGGISPGLSTHSNRAVPLVKEHKDTNYFVATRVIGGDGAWTSTASPTWRAIGCNFGGIASITSSSITIGNNFYAVRWRTCGY